MPDLHHTESTQIGPANIGSDRIARALANAVKLDDASLSELREAMCDYVRVQKGLETPPESIIARAKTLVNHSSAVEAPFEIRHWLTATVVEWCLAAYYGEQRGDVQIHVERPARTDP